MKNASVTPTHRLEEVYFMIPPNKKTLQTPLLELENGHVFNFPKVEEFNPQKKKKQTYK